MSGCFCTGACQRLGYCPNYSGGTSNVPYQYVPPPPDGNHTEFKIYQSISPQDMEAIADLVVKKLKEQS